MSNDKDAENRFWRLHASVGKLILDGKRVPSEVADIYQKYIIDQPQTPAVVEPKFELLVDLGIITVPDDYVHACRLAIFSEQNREKFYILNSNTTDAHFKNPSRILHPGDKLRVRAFQQVLGLTTAPEKCLTFLRRQPGNVFPGVQGMSLVFEQKHDQLSKGRWYSSLDEKERLWEDSNGHCTLSSIGIDSGGDFNWSLTNFSTHVDAFLCFTEVEE